MTISTYIGISLLIVTTGATIKLLASAFVEYTKTQPTQHKYIVESLLKQKQEIKRLRIKCHANEFAMRHIIIEKIDTEEKFQRLLDGAYQFAEHHDRLR